MYQVLLIDDERLVLASLRHRISWERCGFTICGEACNAKDGLEKIRSLHPDLVFTDIRMPGMSGLDLIQLSQTEFPEIHFVVISGYSEFEYAKRAIEYGVLGFCVKPFDEDEIEKLLNRIRIQFEHQANDLTDPVKNENQSAASIRLGDSAEKIDAVLHRLGIPEDEPKWILQILQGQSADSLETQFQKNKIWQLSGIGTCCFLICGSDAPEEAVKILKNSSILSAAGISKAFSSGEGLECAAAEARSAAFGYFFGNPGVHLFTGTLESDKLPEMLRMLRFAFHSRNLTGIHQIVERFRRGTFAIRDAFRFYNTAALLPLEAKLPLCDNYTELATCFSNVRLSYPRTAFGQSLRSIGNDFP